MHEFCGHHFTPQSIMAEDDVREQFWTATLSRFSIVEGQYVSCLATTKKSIQRQFPCLEALENNKERICEVILIAIIPDPDSRAIYNDDTYAHAHFVDDIVRAQRKSRKNIRNRILRVYNKLKKFYDVVPSDVDAITEELSVVEIAPIDPVPVIPPAPACTRLPGQRVVPAPLPAPVPVAVDDDTSQQSNGYGHTYDDVSAITEASNPHPTNRAVAGSLTPLLPEGYQSDEDNDDDNMSIADLREQASLLVTPRTSPRASPRAPPYVPLVEPESEPIPEPPTEPEHVKPAFDDPELYLRRIFVPVRFAEQVMVLFSQYKHTPGDAFVHIVQCEGNNLRIV